MKLDRGSDDGCRSCLSGKKWPNFKSLSKWYAGLLLTICHASRTACFKYDFRASQFSRQGNSWSVERTWNKCIIIDLWWTIINAYFTCWDTSPAISSNGNVSLVSCRYWRAAFSTFPKKSTLVVLLLLFLVVGSVAAGLNNRRSSIIFRSLRLVHDRNASTTIEKRILVFSKLCAFCSWGSWSSPKRVSLRTFVYRLMKLYTTSDRLRSRNT